jgi:hypothetical protein
MFHLELGYLLNLSVKKVVLIIDTKEPLWVVDVQEPIDLYIQVIDLFEQRIVIILEGIDYFKN